MTNTIATSTASINSDSKKVTYKIEGYILHTVLSVIILLIIVIITISNYCYLLSLYKEKVKTKRD